MRSRRKFCRSDSTKALRPSAHFSSLVLLLFLLWSQKDDAHSLEPHSQFGLAPLQTSLNSSKKLWAVMFCSGARINQPALRPKTVLRGWDWGVLEAVHGVTAAFLLKAVAGWRTFPPFPHRTTDECTKQVDRGPTGDAEAALLLIVVATHFQLNREDFVSK